MVEVIISKGADHLNYGGGTPLIHIHSIRREVFGNEIAITVMGEMKIAAGERVWAKELKLKTLQVLNLTPEIFPPDAHGYMAQKNIYNKGEFGNYASIDVYDDAGEWQSSGVGRTDGSVWLDFTALGE